MQKDVIRRNEKTVLSLKGLPWMKSSCPGKKISPFPAPLIIVRCPTIAIQPQLYRLKCVNFCFWYFWYCCRIFPVLFLFFNSCFSFFNYQIVVQGNFGKFALLGIKVMNSIQGSVNERNKVLQRIRKQI